MSGEASGLAERLGAIIVGKLDEKDKAVAALREQSALVATLRQACVLRRDEILTGRSVDGVAELLADAPTLYDAAARPLSLRPLMAQARWLGHVPYVDGEPGADVGPLTAAWTAREADRLFLEAFFPEQARRLRRGEAAAIDPSARPVLDGANMLAKLPIMSGPVSGEIGLSLNPHPRMARLRWIGKRGPLGTTTWSLKGLRLEAALHHPDLTQAPRAGSPGAEARAALAAVMLHVPQLYQMLAREYHPDDDTPRAAVMREHLMDFLGLVMDARDLKTPAAPWLSRLPLMLDRQGKRISLDDLRRRSQDGRKTPVRPLIHPDRLLPLVAGYPDHMRALFAGSDRVELLPPTAPAKPEAALRPPKTA
ncbi:MAG: hypothetical protein KGL53_12525, partial [Elusimicrobia bacterium]|nr:hypothetical protein [Elusimicrobiota bacterium]